MALRNPWAIERDGGFGEAMPYEGRDPWQGGFSRDEQPSAPAVPSPAPEPTPAAEPGFFERFATPQAAWDDWLARMGQFLARKPTETPSFGPWPKIGARRPDRGVGLQRGRERMLYRPGFAGRGLGDRLDFMRLAMR